LVQRVLSRLVSKLAHPSPSPHHLSLSPQFKFLPTFKTPHLRQAQPPSPLPSEAHTTPPSKPAPDRRRSAARGSRGPAAADPVGEGRRSCSQPPRYTRRFLPRITLPSRSDDAPLPELMFGSSASRFPSSVDPRRYRLRSRPLRTSLSRVVLRLIDSVAELSIDCVFRDPLD
jgi:hypothetical protein